MCTATHSSHNVSMSHVRTIQRVSVNVSAPPVSVTVSGQHVNVNTQHSWLILRLYTADDILETFTKCYCLLGDYNPPNMSY